MKFKLDENLGLLGKSLLEADGHNVMTVAEQRLSGAQDERIYEVCQDEGRVLVTLDHDFGQTIRFSPEATAGIVVLECKGRVSPSMILGRMIELATLLRTRPIDREHGLLSLAASAFMSESPKWQGDCRQPLSRPGRRPFPARPEWSKQRPRAGQPQGANPGGRARARPFFVPAYRCVLKDHWA